MRKHRAAVVGAIALVMAFVTAACGGGSSSSSSKSTTPKKGQLTVASTNFPENVILAYAESGWHLRHTGDWTRALAVYTVMADRLDVEWMTLEAERRGQADVLERVMRREPLFPSRLP